MTWFSRFNKQLVEMYHQLNLNVNDVRRGIMSLDIGNRIRVNERHGGFYLEVEMDHRNVGHFAFGVPPSTVRTAGEDKNVDWDIVEKTLIRVLENGAALRNRFWSLVLDPTPALLDSLTLRTSTMIVPADDQERPVEDIGEATQLWLFQYLITPNTTILARLSDSYFDKWRFGNYTPEWFVLNYGLIVTDENAPIRGPYDTLYQQKTPLNVRVTDARELMLPFQDIPTKNHFLSGLVLVDRINRP